MLTGITLWMEERRTVMRAIRLKTADLKNPLGIDRKQPTLSWNCEGGKKQQAYQVTVRDEVSGEMLFDTGRTESDAMYCVYRGKELASRVRGYGM